MMLERPAICRGPFLLASLPSLGDPAGHLASGRPGVPATNAELPRGANGMLQSRAAVDAPLWLWFSAEEDEDRKGQGAERGGGDEGRTGEVKRGCFAGKGAEERGHQQG